MPDFTSFKIMKLCKQIIEDVLSAKNLVTTNNTANETGILSQKLSWLINANKNHGSLEKLQQVAQPGHALPVYMPFMLRLFLRPVEVVLEAEVPVAAELIMQPALAEEVEVAVEEVEAEVLAVLVELLQLAEQLQV